MVDFSRCLPREKLFLFPLAYFCCSLEVKKEYNEKQLWCDFRRFQLKKQGMNFIDSVSCCLEEILDQGLNV